MYVESRSHSIGKYYSTLIICTTFLLPHPCFVCVLETRWCWLGLSSTVPYSSFNTTFIVINGHFIIINFYGKFLFFFILLLEAMLKHSVERYYFLILYFMLRECLAINLLTLLCVALCFTMLVSMMVLFLNLFAYCFFFFIFLL